MNFVSFSQDLARPRFRRSAGLVVVEQVESTHLLGRRLIDEYLREGTRVPEAEIVAWRQVAGRGRLGRGWSSPPGRGAYVTLIRWGSVPEWLQVLPLRAAVALGAAINAHLEGRCRLKWPNDLLVAGKKIGGILIDGVARGDGSPVALISFGVNHGGDLAAFGEPRTTSISHEMPRGEAPSLPTLALELIEALDRELDRDLSAAQIAERYRELSSHTVGDVLRCRVGRDDDAVEGRFLGFDERGFLRLEVAGEERRLSAGEILGRG